MSLIVGAVPSRYHEVVLKKNNTELDLYFAMARGYQKEGLDITAMEMTKWFDTNYHYIVPEFYKNQQFKLSSDKIFNEFAGARQAGIKAKPVIIGLVSYLLLERKKRRGLISWIWQKTFFLCILKSLQDFRNRALSGSSLMSRF